MDHSDSYRVEVEVVGKTLVPVDKELFESIYRTGDRLFVKVSKKPEKPTKNQLGYIGALCTWLTKNVEDFHGWHPTRVRKWIKCVFANEIIHFTIGNETFQYNVPISFARMSVKKTNEVVEALMAHFAEQGIELPPPKNMDTEKYHIIEQDARSVFDDDMNT